MFLVLSLHGQPFIFVFLILSLHGQRFIFVFLNFSLHGPFLTLDMFEPLIHSLQGPFFNSYIIFISLFQAYKVNFQLLCLLKLPNS